MLRSVSRRQSTRTSVDHSSSNSTLDTARLKLQVAADVGDATIAIASLKAAAKLAVQIIDIAKVLMTDPLPRRTLSLLTHQLLVRDSQKMKRNHEECINLAESVARLLVPFVEKLQGHTDADLDSHLKADLVRFNVYVPCAI